MTASLIALEDDVVCHGDDFRVMGLVTHSSGSFHNGFLVYICFKLASVMHT